MADTGTEAALPEDSGVRDEPVRQGPPRRSHNDTGYWVAGSDEDLKAMSSSTLTVFCPRHCTATILPTGLPGRVPPNEAVEKVFDTNADDRVDADGFECRGMEGVDSVTSMPVTFTPDPAAGMSASV
jgi:hypothetical protein